MVVHTIVDGTYRQTNLTGESSEYLAKREELRLAEVELMRQRERIAGLRRNLPEGAPVHDYQFEEGPRDLNAIDAPVRNVRLSELFTRAGSLVGYLSFHVRKEANQGLPHVYGLARRSLDGVARPSGTKPRLRGDRSRGYSSFARPRSHPRLGQDAADQCRGNSSFKYDLGSEDREGAQNSTVSVFTLDANGTMRHFYTAHPRMGPDIPERGIDLLAPIWHFMDLTPRGRGNWYASLAYGTEVHAPPT